MASASPRHPSGFSDSVVFFILPAAVLGLLALTMFFDFLGTQSSELAKLINEIEIQCKADFWNFLGSMPALDPNITGNVSCGAYLPKIIMFFLLVIAWFIVANTYTLKLFEAVKPRYLRFAITSIAAFLLPLILLFKFHSIVPFSFGLSGFSAFTTFVIVEALVIQTIFAIRYFSNADSAPRPIVISVSFFGSIAVFVVVSLLFAFYPANLFEYVGSINTIVLYVVLAYAFVGGLFYYGRATGIPFAALLLIWVVAINALGLNNTHVVETRDVQTTQLKGDEQFLKWFEARQDKAVYADKEYPVYIVASAGGGIYAAMRTAYFLDVLQQNCPAFAHHIFAMSGVSGGGLGTLAFAAQRQSLEETTLGGCNPVDQTNRQANYRQTPILDNFFAKDLISTIVGAGLFPDMLQRVIPWPVDALNRSVAFRKALAENWTVALNDAAEETPSILRKGGGATRNCAEEEFFSECEISSYWNPAGNVPMLVFNATEVDTGSPVVLSNLDSQYYANSLAARNSPSFRQRSIHLIDGASLSARFPIALPAGFLSGFGGTSQIRLVDGGYFDASGLSTAQAVKLALEDLIRRKNLRAKVRIIFLGEKVPGIFDLMMAQARTGQDSEEGGPRGAELTAHAKALFQARDQRSAETLRLVFKIDPTVLRFQWDPVVSGIANTPCSDIPLAWYLAPCTQRVLKQRLQNAVLDSSDYLNILRQELSP